uniref:p49 n=1 Tax=Peanut clump virus N TaxID=188886 RepID=Q8B0Y6_9VIRU|nr:P49 [Peanut clump virus N]
MVKKGTKVSEAMWQRKFNADKEELRKKVDGMKKDAAVDYLLGRIDMQREAEKLLGGNLPEETFSERAPVNRTETDFKKQQSADCKEPVKLGSDKFVGEDPLKLIAKAALEAGFSATGRVMKRFPADVFEKSKFIGMYDRYLMNLREKACCMEERKKVQSKLIQLRTLPPTTSFLAGTVTGVPGSGKSTLLKTIQKELPNSVCLLANKELKNDFAGVPAVFSVEEMLLSAVPSHFNVMLVDEYTLMQSAEILLLQRKIEARIVVLFGDREQGNTNKLTSPEWLHVPIIFSNDSSFRFGSQTAEFCREQGFNLQGQGQDDKVIKGEYEGEGEDTDVNLCFTEETRQDLLEVGVDAFLVENVQGKTFSSVSLFVREGDKFAYSNPHLRLVAITRHRRLLVLRADPEVWVSFMFATREGEQADTHCYGEEHCPNETQ